MSETAPRLYCSFCRKPDTWVEKLIGGPGVYICGDCVGLCNRILEGKPARPFPGFDSLSDVQLLETLPPACAAVDAVREVLHEHVDLLRRREVSWSRIGEALGISRQAAWERFALESDSGVARLFRPRRPGSGSDPDRDSLGRSTGSPWRPRTGTRAGRACAVRA